MAANPSKLSATAEHGLYAALLVGAFLRLFRLGHQSLWGDEALTLQVYTVGDSLIELLSNIWQRAFHPPVYFCVVHYWYKLGSSEFMLRFPSAVFGVAAVPVMYVLARRLFGRGAAAVSAITLALSPFHVWYSQEARMYSLQVLLALGSTLLFLRAWQSRRPVDIAFYGLVTILGLFTHMGTLVLIAAQGVFALGAVVKDWRKHSVWIGIQALAMLAFAPWIANFMAGNRTAEGISAVGFERGDSPLHVGYSLYTFSVGYSLGPSVAELHYLSAADAVRRHLPAIVFPAVVFGTLAVLGLVRAYRVNRFGFWLVFSQFAVPLVLVGAVSLLPGVPLNPRYLVVAVIPYWMILSLGAQVCVRVRPAIVLPAAAAVLVGFSLYNHYFQPAYAKQDMRSAVALVNEKARPGDVIIISSIEMGGPFIYYFERRDVPYFGYPPRPGLVDPDDLPSDLSRILSGRKRAWLILGRTWSSDPEGLVSDSLEARYALVEHEEYPGVSVRCFHIARSADIQTSRRMHD